MSFVHTEQLDENRKQVKHTLHMERRNRVVLTGVLDVSSFHENEIILKTDSGVMVITGEALHIGTLLIEDGRLDIHGRIDGIIYENGRKSRRTLSDWFRSEK